MLHILGAALSLVMLAMALAVVLDTILGNREAIARALGWAPTSPLQPLPSLATRIREVRVVRRVHAPVLRLAA